MRWGRLDVDPAKVGCPMNAILFPHAVSVRLSPDY